VMCFGLFSTSAFATSLAHFDFSGGNTAENSNTAGGGFDFNPVGSSGSQSNSNSSFDFGGQQTQPASVEPQQQATTSEPTLSTQDTPMLGTPYSGSETWAFVPESVEILKSDEAQNIEIKSDHSNDFDSDSFDGGFGYSTKSNGTDMVALKQGVDYSISKNKLTLYSSWVKSLPVGMYYVFGISTTSTLTKITRITINSGSFGPFTMYNTPYNKNKTDDLVVWANGTGMSSFVGFGIVGVTDSSYTKVLAVNNEYTSNSTSVTLKASFLNALADGTYTLVGFTTSSDFNKDQVVIGNFVIESGALGVSYKIVTGPDGVYDKSKPLSDTNFCFR